MSTTQSKYGRRFDEEFKREVAALACRPGARQEQVARDLGVSPYSVSRWKKRYGGAPAAAAAVPSGVSVQELERRIKAMDVSAVGGLSVRAVACFGVHAVIFMEPPCTMTTFSLQERPGRVGAFARMPDPRREI